MCVCVSPTQSGDGDEGWFAGRAVADASHTAVIGGGRQQPRHRGHVRLGRLGLSGLQGEKRDKSVCVCV